MLRKLTLSRKFTFVFVLCIIIIIGDVGKDSSTLKQDIEYFVKVLTAFALLQAITIFIVGLSKGLDPIVVFVNGFVIIMIGNIPQGLPTTVTACLFIVADNMGKYRCSHQNIPLLYVFKYVTQYLSISI